MDYKIIENFLDKEEFLNIQQKLMFPDFDFPWYFREHMNREDGHYFRHILYGNHTPMSKGFDDIARPILKKLNCISPITIKANMIIAKEVPFQSEFHIDKHFECKTAIFYINTCNGYTLIDKKKKIKVACEANKILIFNSNIQHALVSQTDTPRRIVINLNYL
jgi:hypothetical protein